ncbi:hypothetical protein PP655_gp100 [Bacillus phage PBC4]|uniref:Uncharacterized protein n=1 Tax=Bacillus phage PBC4 TaxID=1675028 RepID=A0A1D6X8C6_9CAUD|nr:hypothetical protein PP655_gp100 [Bacillus phage PBC4]AKQ08292.1 hypothetical protein PBC4_100 [Bacillus phage PBC4]
MNKTDLKNLNAFIDGYNKLVEETGFDYTDVYPQRPVVEKVNDISIGFDFSKDETGKYGIPSIHKDHRKEEGYENSVWEEYEFNRETGEHDILVGTFTLGEKGKYIKLK